MLRSGGSLSDTLKITVKKDVGAITHASDAIPPTLPSLHFFAPGSRKKNNLGCTSEEEEEAGGVGGGGEEEEEDEEEEDYDHDHDD